VLSPVLGGTDPKNPLALPLDGDLKGPPNPCPLGDDEVLLDDPRRYVKRAIAAGVDAKLAVSGWKCLMGSSTALETCRPPTRHRAIGAYLSGKIRLPPPGTSPHPGPYRPARPRKREYREEKEKGEK
jgi:hypothetical protein